MTKYILASSVYTDVGALPLHLAMPDGFNNGGYLVPDGNGKSKPAYSSIDLLVAGIEATIRNEKVSDLTQYFGKHKTMMADDLVSLQILNRESKDLFLAGSILVIKNIVIATSNTDCLHMLKMNAPLTFKWVRI